jgi:hypothetical protein
MLDRVVMRAVEQLECWLAEGVQAAMNQWNGVETDAKA